MNIEKKKFNDIYAEIVAETKNFFDDLRKKQARNFGVATIGAIVIAAIVYLMDRHDFMLCIPFTLCLIMLFFFLGNYHYRKQYKETIIGLLINKYNSNFRYTQDGGPISNADYLEAGFDKNWDIMEKNDGVIGDLEDGSRFRMAQITTFKNVTYLDDNGEKRLKKEQTYKGTFCVVTLNKMIPNQIDILANTRKYKYNKNKIEVDSENFEKEFDMIAKDRVQALRIFTPEIIEILVSLKERIKVTYRVRIDGDRIYIKIDNGDIFEPISYKAELTASALLEYYNTIDIPVTLATTIIRGARDL